MTYFTTGAQLQAALNALPNTKTGDFVAFDSFFYGQQYMADYQGTLSPIEHFVQIGAARGYKPNATFDPTYYKNAFADLKNTDFNAADLLYHFMQYGLDEGRTPNAALATFDGTAYLAANPDVAAYVNANLAQFGGSVTNGALAHYVKFGAAEGRTAPGTSVSNGQTFMLTTGIDSGPAFTGGAGNDTFDATKGAAGAATFTQLDSLDGGGGQNTLNIAQAAAFVDIPSATVKNIQTVNIASGADVNVNTTGWAGVTQLNVVSSAAAGENITAATTTGVTVANSTAQTVTVVGGGNTASVTNGAGNIIIGNATLPTAADANAYTSVSLKGGLANAVTDNSGTAGAVGSKLTSITLDAVGATTALTGNGIVDLTLKNQQATSATTITNATSKALTVNADGVGYTAAGAAAAVSVAAGAAATTLNVNATGAKSALTLTGAAATTVNITGSAALDLVAVPTATKIDGSAATGNLTLNTLAAGTVNVKTGSGNDSLTATVAAAKIAVDTGAGNDSVTLGGAALVVGSTVNLGAGNDKLIGTTAILKAGAGVTDSVIDGGEGFDSVSAALINAGNASLFKNFEGLGLNSTTGLDVALLTGSTITGLSIDSLTTNALYQNLTLGTTLDVSFVGNNSAFTNTLSFKGATGAADTLAIKFSADNSAAVTAPIAANVQAGTISAAAIENFTVDSSGTKAWNEIKLAGTEATTVTISGASNLDLTFGVIGKTGAGNGVSSIDGSAATGKLNIDVAGVVAASTGLTVKGGSAADTLTTSTFATTLTGGAGADTFVVTAAKAGAVATATGQVITTITDAAASDILSFGGAATSMFVKADVGTATALSGGTTNAYELAAAAANGAAADSAAWFNYGGDTYIVADVGATAGSLDTTDVIVKLAGVVDLSSASLNATFDLVFA